MTDGVYVLSCRLTSAPLWLGIYLFLWWFLLVIFGLFLLHWRYELPCQDKLPEFHSTPILGCIRILWLVSHPLGLGLDKALCGWNSVNHGNNSKYYEETLYPVDHEQAGQIRDFSLFHHFVRPSRAGVMATCVLDCCHSGTVLDLRYQYQPTKVNTIRVQ